MMTAVMLSSEPPAFVTRTQQEVVSVSAGVVYQLRLDPIGIEVSPL